MASHALSRDVPAMATSNMAATPGHTFRSGNLSPIPGSKVRRAAQDVARQEIGHFYLVAH